MKDYRVIIGAPIFNASPYIKPIFDNINKLVEEFKDVRVVLVESNSWDNTNETIESFRDYLNCPLELHCITNRNQVQSEASPTFQIRTARIANARNYLMDIVEEDYSDYDYLFSMDFNYSNADPIDLDAVRSNFELKKDWNVVTANQAGIYYDLWALRHKTWLPFNCFGKIWDDLQWMPYLERRALILGTRKIVISPDTPPILTDSSWGGAGIIKIKAIKGARYSWVDEDAYADCEHPSFMKQIGKVYINPKFINWRTGPEQPDDPKIEWSLSPVMGRE